MNKSQHTAALAAAHARLAVARKIEQAFHVFGPVELLDETVGTAWNAAHDMISSFEAQIENLEREGYGRSRVSAETQALVSANID